MRVWAPGKRRDFWNPVICEQSSMVTCLRRLRGALVEANGKERHPAGGTVGSWQLVAKDVGEGDSEGPRDRRSG